MRRLSGVKRLDEQEGEGEPARIGDRVVYNTRTFLNQGDEVRIQGAKAAILPPDRLRVVDRITWVDHTTVLGTRQCIAGVEHALIGMKVGCYRKVRISPHLAYRDQGVPDYIPPNAILIVEIWLRAIMVGAVVERRS